MEIRILLQAFASIPDGPAAPLVLSAALAMAASSMLVKMLKNGEKPPNPKNFYEVKWLSDDGMKLKISEKNAPDPGKPDTYQVQWYDGLKLKLSKT